MISAAEFLKWCEVFQVAINGSGGGGGGGSVNSVVGTANRITSTGGVNPVIDISAAYVGQTSITTLGNIATGAWQGTLISSTYGGTGVNNGASTITLGGSLTTSGGFTTTLTVTGNTNVTLPTSGTLLTSAGAVTSITGTADQVVASASTGAVTLSLPQSIATGSSPTFVTETLSGLTASQAVVTDGSKVLSSLAYTTAATASALSQRDSNANIAANRATLNSNVLTMSGTLTLVASDAQYQFLNPNGSNRTVQLPTATTGMLFIIKNTGTAGNTLLVQDSSAAQIGNLVSNGLVVGYFYEGTTWRTV